MQDTDPDTFDFLLILTLLMPPPTPGHAPSLSQYEKASFPKESSLIVNFDINVLFKAFTHFQISREKVMAFVSFSIRVKSSGN